MYHNTTTATTKDLYRKYCVRIHRYTNCKKHVLLHFSTHTIQLHSLYSLPPPRRSLPTHLHVIITRIHTSTHVHRYVLFISGQVKIQHFNSNVRTSFTACVEITFFFTSISSIYASYITHLSFFTV